MIVVIPNFIISFDRTKLEDDLLEDLAAIGSDDLPVGTFNTWLLELKNPLKAPNRQASTG